MFRDCLDENADKIKQENRVEDLCAQLGQIFKTAAVQSIPKSSTTHVYKDKMPSYITETIKLKNKWSRKYKKSKSLEAKEIASSLKSSILIEISLYRAYGVAIEDLI